MALNGLNCKLLSHDILSSSNSIEFITNIKQAFSTFFGIVLDIKTFVPYGVLEKLLTQRMRY